VAEGIIAQLLTFPRIDASIIAVASPFKLLDEGLNLHNGEVGILVVDMLRCRDVRVHKLKIFNGSKQWSSYAFSLCGHGEDASFRSTYNRLTQSTARTFRPHGGV
jgi:hypothetical protein